MTKILLIEDDEACAYALQGGLELLDGYEVALAGNGKEGLETLESFSPDVIVTDIDMPEMDGFEFVERVRAKNESIVIIVESGKTMPKDVLKGYELGIDDYIKKPFVAEELHAHIRAILKRLDDKPAGGESASDDCFHIGCYKFDFQEKTLELRMQKQKLTQREANILKMLYDHKNVVVSREKILTDFWDSTDYFHSRSLDVFISKLRKYLAHDESIRIITEKGKGIKLEI